MKIHIITLLMTILAAGAAFAQGDGFATLDRVRGAEFQTLRGEIRSEVTTNRIGEEEAVTRVVILDVSLDAPNRFRIEAISPTADGDGLAVCDGSHALWVSHMLGQMISSDSPAEFAAIEERDMQLIGAGSALLGVLFDWDPDALAPLMPASGFEEQALEPRRVAGALCDVFEYTSIIGGSLQRITLAIDSETGNLMSLEAEQGPEDGEPLLVVREAFTSLTLNAPIPDGAFAIETPEGFTQVERFDPTNPAPHLGEN